MPAVLVLALALASCATYNDSSNAHPSNAAGSSGSDANGGAGAGSAGLGASAGGADSAGGDTQQGGAGSAGVAASAGGPASGAGGKPSSAGNGGSAGTVGAAGSAGLASGGTAGGGGTAGSAGNGGSGGSAGSAGRGGSGGTAGSAGSGGSGGTAGSAGSGGSGGGTEHLLSLGKAASADSEETAKGNLAGLGNDGSLTTRWCAADGAVGHYWQVDLGVSSTITKLQVNWEKAAIYKFKAEGSADGSTWSMILDQTSSTNASADQTYSLAALPKARWVRVTVTGLASSTTWASFFELSVFGY